MKRLLFVIGILIGNLFVPKASSASTATSTTGIAVIAERFNHPQFISNNDDALTLLLALLDYAAKGALQFSLAAPGGSCTRNNLR